MLQRGLCPNAAIDPKCSGKGLQPLTLQTVAVHCSIKNWISQYTDLKFASYAS